MNAAVGHAWMHLAVVLMVAALLPRADLHCFFDTMVGASAMGAILPPSLSSVSCLRQKPEGIFFFS